MTQVVQHETRAGLARTALAAARTATLRTRSCRTAATETEVSLAWSAAGVPRVRLEGSAPAVAALAACRVASLSVPGPDGWTLRLTGSFTMDRPDETGRRTYAATLLSVRLVPADGVDPADREVVVPVDAFLRARPDAAAASGAALAHLASTHAEDLLARARAEGYDALAVVPTALDGDGVELSVLTASGVDSWRAPLSCPCAALS